MLSGLPTSQTLKICFIPVISDTFTLWKIFRIFVTQKSVNCLSFQNEYHKYNTGF